MEDPVLNVEKTRVSKEVFSIRINYSIIRGEGTIFQVYATWYHQNAIELDHLATPWTPGPPGTHFRGDVLQWLPCGEPKDVGHTRGTLSIRFNPFPGYDCWILVVGIYGFRVSSKAGDIRSCFSKIGTPNPSWSRLSSCFFSPQETTICFVLAISTSCVPNPARPSFHQWNSSSCKPE